jgi:hypothetical protein
LGVGRIGKTGNPTMENPAGSTARLSARILTCTLVLCLAAALAACSRIDRDDAMVDQLVEMEGGTEREVSEQRVEEIEQEIRRYRGEVERKVDASGQLGIYYKMLAVEYMRGAMYATPTMPWSRPLPSSRRIPSSSTTPRCARLVWRKPR